MDRTERGEELSRISIEMSFERLAGRTSGEGEGSSLIIFVFLIVITFPVINLGDILC